MSSDDFGAFGEMPSSDRSDAAIHILIEDNGQPNTQPMSTNSTFPNVSARRNINSSNSSSSLHTMFNRMRQHTLGNNFGRNGNGREWPMNFNDVLSFSQAPRTLRSLISHSGNFRYANLPSSSGNNASSSTDNIHFHFDNPENTDRTSESINAGRLLHSPRTHESSQYNRRGNLFNDAASSGVYVPGSEPTINNTNNEIHQETNLINDGMPEAEMNAGEIQPPAPQHARSDDDNTNNVFSDIFVRVLGNFVRYLPFLAILFVKFIHDHLIGILDIILLQSIMYTVNKSLCNQISKFSQKSYCVLLRDCGLIMAAVAYRLMLSPTSPDPLGLIISPPLENIILEVSTSSKSIAEQSNALKVLSKYLNFLSTKETQDLGVGNTVTMTKTLSLGLLIYYIAANDLFLKLLTILTKILITMLPNEFLRHKQKARMYVLFEYFSQFYRSLAPIKQWLQFLFESYTGLEVMSGLLFSGIYLGAKCFELTNRGKMLKKSFINFIRNMDYERKPTKDELEGAEQICPICHDAYNTPIILSCNHIFCDDCVSQWFKREQTCPLCRAKVCEDPQWQDGSTTYFYQLC